jgi:hypothetical protein
MASSPSAAASATVSRSQIQAVSTTPPVSLTTGGVLASRPERDGIRPATIGHFLANGASRFANIATLAASAERTNGELEVTSLLSLANSEVLASPVSAVSHQELANGWTVSNHRPVHKADEVAPSTEVADHEPVLPTGQNDEKHPANVVAAGERQITDLGRRILATFQQSSPGVSNRTISKELGCSKGTVGDWRAYWTKLGQLPPMPVHQLSTQEDAN